MAIKLLAMDIDGTLLDSSGKLSRENKEAIDLARKSGIQIVLATGRPPQSVAYLLAELNLLGDEDLVITNNGGLIHYSKSGKIIHERLLNRAEIMDLYYLSQKLAMPVDLIDSDYVYQPTPTKGIESIYKKGAQKALKFKNLEMAFLPQNFKVNQLIMSRPAEELDQAFAKIPDSYHEKYTISRSVETILEFLPKHTNKGNALEFLCEYLGYDKSETSGIGDQENDLSLIKAAGIGVAMGNGIDQIKRVADYQTKTNDEDGLAYAIRKFIL